MATMPDTPVKGSWEDLLQTAEVLATDYNFEAIPIYEKLVSRLGKMPSVRRHAADDRLQNIYLQSAVDLYQLLLMRERYDEALTVLDILIKETPIDESLLWGSVRLGVLVQAGRESEVLDLLLTVAQDEDADLDDWYLAAAQQLRQRILDGVADTIESMDTWIENRYGDETPEARQRDAAVVEMVRVRQQFGLGEWKAGIDHYLRAIELDDEVRERLPDVYLELLMYGRHAEAIPLVRRDRASQVRPNFWLGYAHFLADDLPSAEAHWRKALDADLEKEENRQYVEWFLPSFYLEDRRDGGLATVLNILQDEEGRQWPLFCLAGLGWALRGDVNSAKSNLETALLICRAEVSGRLLPVEFWAHFKALLSPQLQAKLIGYFDVDTNAFHTSASDLSEPDVHEPDAQTEREDIDE